MESRLCGIRAQADDLGPRIPIGQKVREKLHLGRQGGDFERKKSQGETVSAVQLLIRPYFNSLLL